ncbi:MAG: hypothetical protein IT495_17620 [Gammaproteobacteria bacterium]|nr:hypothetical protein [Gammaproteobacteria bacterium]
MRCNRRFPLHLAGFFALACLASGAQAAVVSLTAGQTLIQVYDFSADPVQPPYVTAISVYQFPNADGFDVGDSWSLQVFDSANQLLGGAGVSWTFLGGLVGSTGFGQGFTLGQVTSDTQITARLTMLTGHMDVDYRLAMRDAGAASTTQLPMSVTIVPLPPALPLFAAALLGLIRTGRTRTEA